MLKINDILILCFTDNICKINLYAVSFYIINQQIVIAFKRFFLYIIL